MSDVVNKIEYQKDNAFIYRFEKTRFNALTTIVVPSGTQAVLFLNGKALDVLPEGEYTFEYHNIPKVYGLLERQQGDMTEFDCGVCFVNLDSKIEFDWQAEDGTKGTASIAAVDSVALVSKLLMFTDLEQSSVCEFFKNAVSRGAALDDAGVKADINVTYRPEIIEQKPGSETKEQPTPEPTPEAEPEIKEAPKTEPAAKPKSKLPLILGIAAVAIVVLCVVIAVVFRPSDNKPKYETNEHGYQVDENNNVVLPSEDDIKTVDISKAEVNDFVEFGTYEQDNNLENGAEKLVWKVLEKQDGKLKLITNLCVDCVQYNSTYVEIDWRNSSVRKWLNGDFYNAAFSDKDKEKIAITSNVNALDTNYNLENGNNTDDNVYLLSLTEVKHYFAGSEAYRQAKPTAFAVANGAYVEVDSGNCWWWLRSPGDTALSAGFVEADGYAGPYGNGVDSNLTTVRPCITIDLSK